MATVLVTGANRGLGLEFCRQYADKGDRVIACCRNPLRAEQLTALTQHYSTIQVETLDVADFHQIDALALKYNDTDIDILINNAGVYDDKSSQGFGKLDYQAWSNSFLINSQAPIKLAEVFLPQVSRSSKKLIVAISSLMGSIADNGSGGSMLYRSSKSALNSVMKTLAIEVKDQGIGVIIFHPGWVQTAMGGPNALIDAKTSVAGMCEQIDKFNFNQTGKFIKYDGKAMPW